jgi:methyltransferase-like protein
MIYQKLVFNKFICNDMKNNDLLVKVNEIINEYVDKYISIEDLKNYSKNKIKRFYRCINL